MAKSKKKRKATAKQLANLAKGRETLAFKLYGRKSAKFPRAYTHVPHAGMPGAKKCKICNLHHTTSQHNFHGMKSFQETHKALKSAQKAITKALKSNPLKSMKK